MINLTTTSDIIRIVTAGTQSIQVHASWMDNPATPPPVPGRTNTVITTAATTTVVPNPTLSSTQRNVKTLSICNTDSTNSDVITVQFFDGTTSFQLIKLALPAGYTLTWTDEAGWILSDASGGRVETPLGGRFLKSTLVSAGTTFTTGPSTNLLWIRMVGGGGGGGGCTSVASAASAAGGGGAGGYLEKLAVATPNTTYNLLIGGAGVGSSGAGGTSASSSQVTIGATAYTALGGSGAPAAAASASANVAAGGAGATVSTNGDVNTGGQPGAAGVCLTPATPVMVSGAGGSSPFGAGGLGTAVAAAGNNATGFGAGGGGAATGASTARAGGNGTGGCIVFYEYS